MEKTLDPERLYNLSKVAKLSKITMQEVEKRSKSSLLDTKDTGQFRFNDAFEMMHFNSKSFNDSFTIFWFQIAFDMSSVKDINTPFSCEMGEVSC